MKASACLSEEARDLLALMSGRAYLHKQVLDACKLYVMFDLLSKHVLPTVDLSLLLIRKVQTTSSAGPVIHLTGVGTDGQKQMTQHWYGPGLHAIH